MHDDGSVAVPTDGGYVRVFSSARAFVAMKADGSLSGWGHGNQREVYAMTGQPFEKNWGATLPSGIGAGFVTVSSTPYTFAALRGNGEIVSWGHFNGGTAEWIGPSTRPWLNNIMPMLLIPIMVNTQQLVPKCQYCSGIYIIMI